MGPFNSNGPHKIIVIPMYCSDRLTAMSIKTLQAVEITSIPAAYPQNGTFTRTSADPVCADVMRTVTTGVGQFQCAERCNSDQRAWYRRTEAAKAGECLAMLWYMWLVLPFMVSFCATQPRDGMMAYLPWIGYAAVALFAKALQLLRLRAQVRVKRGLF